MLRKVKALVLAMAVTATAFCGVGITASASSSLPSSKGIKGCSVPAAWYDSQSYSALSTIKNDGFNTVRLVWTTSMSSSRLDTYLTKCDSLGLKAIVELHDATGSTSTSDLNTCANYWASSSVLAVLKKHTSDWVNIANEWGPSNSTTWRDGYLSAVSKIRTAGYTGVLVIDAGGWGQDGNDILNYASAILASNTNKSVMFSIHMYGSWNSTTDVDKFMSSCHSKSIPIMVGEFGYNYNNGSNNLGCKVNATHLMNVCKYWRYGFCAWSWCGNDSSNAWLDMTSSSNWSSLTTWGKLVKSYSL